MSTSSSRPQNPNTEYIALFIARVRERIQGFLHGPKPAYLLPLSWILTLQIFAISTIWYISAIPLRIGLDIYERHIRAIFPQLPSIRKELLSIRTAVLGFFPNPPPNPGVGSSAAGPRSHRGRQNASASAAPLPTLNVDLNALRAGGA